MAGESGDTRLLPEVARPWVDALSERFGPRVESRLIEAARPLVDQCIACGGPTGAGAVWSPAPSPCWTNTGAVTEWFGTARDVTAERATEGLPKESGRAIADQALFGSFRARRSDDTDARREARRCFGRSDRSTLSKDPPHKLGRQQEHRP